MSSLGLKLSDLTTKAQMLKSHKALHRKSIQGQLLFIFHKAEISHQKFLNEGL